MLMGSRRVLLLLHMVAQLSRYVVPAMKRSGSLCCCLLRCCCVSSCMSAACQQHTRRCMSARWCVRLMIGHAARYPQSACLPSSLEHKGFSTCPVVQHYRIVECMSSGALGGLLLIVKGGRAMVLTCPAWGVVLRQPQRMAGAH
jgi:hypothetical protein